MDQPICKLAIIDGDLELTEIVKRYLTDLGCFKIVGTAADGDSGLKMIRNFELDVVLIDLIIPRKDGVYILEELSKQPAKKPCCIMFSSITQSKIAQKALDKGADYFILKPFDLDFLAWRIKEVWECIKQSESGASMSNQMTLKIPETFVLQVLQELPIPINKEGFALLKSALLLTINHPDLLNSVTKKLYPAVGKENKMNDRQAERAMRHVIHSAWNKGAGTIYAHILGHDVLEFPRPSISEFLSLLVKRYHSI